MNNIELDKLISEIKFYAYIADNIGDYKTADECYELLKIAENFNNSNIRTAMEREAFFRGLGKKLKGLAKGLGKVLKNPLFLAAATTLLTGGAGAAFLSKLGPAAKALAPKVLNFLQSGGDVNSLLGPNVDPNIKDIASKLIAETKSGKQTPSYQDLVARGMQTGMSDTMAKATSTMGFSPTTDQTNQQALTTAFNTAVNNLARATPQTVNNIINTFKSQAQQILNQEIQLQKTKNPNALTPTEQDLKIPQYIQILTDRARKAKLL